MAESVGAAVFTVDADISRFDQRLSEAQSRAVRAVQGINASLQSIQGADVVINQVGTLNLSNEINQIKAYRGELGALKTQLHTLRNTPTTRATMLASGRTAGYDTGATMTLKNYETEMARVVAGVKAKESQVATIISETTAKIKASMAERVAASKQFRNAITRQYERLKGGYFPGIGEPTKDITVPGLDPKNMRTRAVMSSTAVGTASVGATSGKYSTGSYAESVLKEAELLRSGYEDQLAMMEKYNVRRNAVYESGIQRFQTISRQEEVALEQHNAKMKALMKSGYQGIGFEDYIDRYPYSSGKKATAVGSLEMSREEVNFKRIAQNKAREYSNIGTSMFLGDFKSSEEASKALAKVNKESTAMSKAMKEAHEPASLLDRALGRLSRTLFAFTGVYAFVELISSLHQAVSAGVEFNRTIENTRIGMSALLEAEGQFTRSGAVLTGIDSMNAALNQSDQIIKQLQYDNLQTVATFEQLVRAYQSAMAPGLAAGFDLKQIRQFTLSMVQAAAAMQLPFEQMAEEIRSLLRGTITPRNTIIATNLGITNEDIRKYKGDAKGLFDFIMGKLEKFNAYGPLMANTFSGLFSNLTDMFRLVAGTAGAPFFEYLKTVMRDLIEYLVDINKESGAITIRPTALKAMQDFYEIIQSITSLMLNLTKMMTGITAALGTILSHIKSELSPILSIIENIIKKNDAARKEVESRGGKYDIWSDSGYMDAGVEAAMGIVTAPVASVSEAYKNSSEKLQSYMTLLIITKNAMDSLEASGDNQSKLFYELAATYGRTKVEVENYSKEVAKTIDETHNFAMEMMYAGNAMDNIAYSATNATRDIDDFYAALKKAGGVDLSKMGASLDDKIENLEIEIAALESGVKRGARVDATVKLEKANRELKKTTQLMQDVPGVSDPVLVKAFNQAKDNQVKAQKLYDLTIKREDIDDSQRSAEKAYRKKSGGGGGGGRPISVEKIANEMRELEKEKEKWNRKLLDMDTDYDIKRLEASGRTFDAQIMQIDKQSKAQMEEYQSNIDDLQAKITEYKTKNLDENARNELNKTATMLDFLKEKQEEYNSKVEREANLEKDLAKQQDQAKMAKDIVDLNLQYAEMVGTREEILALTIKQIEAEAELRKIENPQYAKEIERNKNAQIARTKALEGDDFGAGFMVTARDAFQELGGWGKIGADAFTMLSDSISSTADTLTEFLTTGKIEFADFANSIIKDMIRIITQRLIMNAVFGVINLISPLSGAASGGIGNLLSGSKIMSTQAFHNGLGTVSKMVPDSYFFNAPRLHDGLAADEYPAILQKGEAVIPKNHSLANTSNITVNITQNGDSGNASDAQILAKIVAKAVDEKIQQSFRKQMRNGGILDSHKRVA